MQDKDLAKQLNKNHGYKCVSGDQYREVFRGIRQHLSRFLVSNQEENITKEKLSKANLGLAHALARHSIKYDVKKQDKTIINAYSLLEQMEKNLNTFCMRIKESYGWHFPELSKIILDNENYVKLVFLIGNKDNLTKIDTDRILEIVGDEEIISRIMEK